MNTHMYSMHITYTHMYMWTLTFNTVEPQVHPQYFETSKGERKTVIQQIYFTLPCCYYFENPHMKNTKTHVPILESHYV